MDALSAPVSTLRPAAFLFAAPRDPHLLKPPPPNSHPSLYPSLSNKPKPSPPSSSLSHHFPNSKPPILSSLSQSDHRSPHTANFKIHRTASAGYAAALLDIARCHGAIDAVERDARRIALDVRAINADPSVNKEEVVRGVVEGGGFCKQVTVLVRMLVGKGKVGLVGQVMEDFGRMYDELTGTRIVVVPSEGRMEEEELAGIARRVQRASGAAKVKVRNLVYRSPGELGFVGT